jgi:hypothetical protein
VNHNTAVVGLGGLLAAIGLSAGVVVDFDHPNLDPAVVSRNLASEPLAMAASWQAPRPVSGELVHAAFAAPAGEVATRQLPAAEQFLTVVVGQGADAELGTALPQAFAGYRGDIAAEFVGATDRDAIEQVRLARADAALVTGNLTERDRAFGLQSAEIGLELYALVVPTTSPVRSLTAAQVRALLRGETMYWSELGYDLGPIRLVAPRDEALRARAARALCRGDNLDVRSEASPSDQATQNRVRDTANAIGLIRLRDGGVGNELRPLQIDWTEPGADTFASGRYPFGTRLQLVTKGLPQRQTALLLEFLRSADGRELLGRNLLPR